MKFLICLFTFAFLGFTALSCNNCRLVDCAGSTGTIQLRLMRNGQNALYGPEAFINRDSLRYFINEPIERDYIIGFPENTQSITLFMEEGLEHILQISNIRTDTLVSTMEVTDMGECCHLYEFMNVTINGQVICDHQNCEDIIEIEI